MSRMRLMRPQTMSALLRPSPCSASVAVAPTNRTAARWLSTWRPSPPSSAANHHSRPRLAKTSSPSSSSPFSARIHPLRHYSTPAETQSCVAPVPHRGVLELKGRDALKLLQGLISNDVKHLTTGNQGMPGEGGGGEGTALLAAFMNPQGRMLAEGFVHPLSLPPSPTSTEAHLLIDTDSRSLPALHAFIKRFKLRSKVTLRDASEEWDVWHAWEGAHRGEAPDAQRLMQGAEQQEGTIIAKDGRASGMGWRVLVPKGQQPALEERFVTAAPEDYTIHRVLRGVPEGALDIVEGSALPLESCLDYMHGVDFRKGCYVGQELTARTHHKGVTRKRLMPVSLYREGDPVPTRLAVDRSISFALPAPATDVRSTPLGGATSSDENVPRRPTRARSAGKFMSGIHNIGIASLRLDQVARWAGSEQDAGPDALRMSVESEEGTLLLRPWTPDWWPPPPEEVTEE